MVMVSRLSRDPEALLAKANQIVAEHEAAFQEHLDAHDRALQAEYESAMTVADLIKLLADMPQDYPVTAYNVDVGSTDYLAACDVLRSTNEYGQPVIQIG